MLSAITKISLTVTTKARIVDICISSTLLVNTNNLIFYAFNIQQDLLLVDLLHHKTNAIKQAS